MTDEPTLLDYFQALAQTREGRKDLTFAVSNGEGSDPEASAESARRAWEWVDDPTKELFYDR